MAVEGAGTPISRYDLKEGGHLTLYRSCVVERTPTHVEVVPLANVLAARVSFERDRRKVNWGIALMVLAILMFAISGPLALFASGAASDMHGGTQGVARALLLLFRFLELAGSLLPALSFAAVIGGGALCALGWRGATVLVLSLAGMERVYASRGQDKLLLDFAELVGERLMTLER